MVTKLDMSLYSLSDYDEEEEEDLKLSKLKVQQTKTNLTLTDSTILHPDPDICCMTSSSYSDYQLSCGFESSLNSSRRMSRMSSCSDLRPLGSQVYSGGYGTNTTYSTGIANVINERNIHGGSRMSLLSDTPSKTSSIITGLSVDVADLKSFSPTGTPSNSPLHSPGADSGIVNRFFSTLKASFYGTESTPKRKYPTPKRSNSSQRFGILEKVEEVGVENLMTNEKPKFEIVDEFYYQRFRSGLYEYSRRFRRINGN